MLENYYHLLGVFIVINIIVLIISIAIQITRLGVKEGSLIGLVTGLIIMFCFSLSIRFLLCIVYIGSYIGDSINAIY